MATVPPGRARGQDVEPVEVTVPPMMGGGGGDGAIACSRQGEVEDDHDVHHSRVGAAQEAAGGLGALDEKQSFLDAAHGDETRAKVRINGPSPSKVAAVVVRVRVEAPYLHKICRGVVVDARSLSA